MTAVSDKFWHDTRLSIEAKAVLAYFHSRPAGADIRVMEAREALRVGADRTRRVMRELLAGGYVKLAGGRAGNYYSLVDLTAAAASAAALECLPWSEISPRSCVAPPARGAK